jgi:rRNA-processing protein FCF1
MKVILDTNFLVDCMRFKVDLNSELAGNELFVLDSVIFEIEKIVDRRTSESSLAKLALEFINKNNIRQLKSEEKSVDDSLISYSKQGYVIATHDRELKSKLKSVGAKLIYVRQKRYLVTEG